MRRDLLFEKRALCSFAGYQPHQPMHGASLNLTMSSVGGVIHLAPISSRGAHTNPALQFNLDAAREVATAMLKMCDAAESAKK